SFTVATSAGRGGRAGGGGAPGLVVVRAALGASIGGGVPVSVIARGTATGISAAWRGALGSASSRSASGAGGGTVMYVSEVGPDGSGVARGATPSPVSVGVTGASGRCAPSIAGRAPTPVSVGVIGGNGSCAAGASGRRPTPVAVGVLGCAGRCPPRLVGGTRRGAVFGGATRALSCGAGGSGSPIATHWASALIASIRPCTGGGIGRGALGSSAGRGGMLGGAGFIASRA